MKKNKIQCILCVLVIIFVSCSFLKADTYIQSGDLKLAVKKGGSSSGVIMLNDQELFKSWAYVALKTSDKKYEASILNSLPSQAKEKPFKISCSKSFPTIGYKRSISVSEISKGFCIQIESSFNKECKVPFIYCNPLLSWDVLNGSKYEGIDENENEFSGKISPRKSKKERKIPLRTNLKKIKFHLKKGGTVTISLKQTKELKFLHYLAIVKRNDKYELRLRLFQGYKTGVFPKGYLGEIEIRIEYEKNTNVKKVTNEK